MGAEGGEFACQSIHLVVSSQSSKFWRRGTRSSSRDGGGRTIASCSFSISRCSIAGVIGCGCLMGTPVSDMLGLNGGKGRCPCCTLAGMVPPGDASGRGGGFIGYICEARREGGADGRRESGCGVCCVTEDAFRGEGGTEFKSGAMTSS